MNSTFYRLPLETTLTRWCRITPEDFVFAVKAGRFITHIKRLDEPHKTVAPFLGRIRCLGSKLGPVLLQLPSHFPFNGGKLDVLCKVLDNDIRYAFEFRDPGWFRQETCDILSRYRIAFCIYDFAGNQSPDVVTADFVYARLHGPLKSPYRGSYSEKFLEGWTGKIRRWIKEGKAVYIFFDNTMEGDAVRNAMTLCQMNGLAEKS